MSAGRSGRLGALLAPGSVAIIGASSDPTRIGGRVLSYHIAGGFAGAIYPINPNRPEVQGLPAYPSLDAVPGPVDVAIIALPANRVVEAAGACAARGVKGAIVFSSGFAETGEEGRAAEAALGRIARETGMRILGPNCLGAFAPHVGFYGTFTNTLDRGFPRPGGLSIASQSGAFGSHISYLAGKRGLGLRYWISTGNECDVDVAECVSFLADDPETRVIVLYLEGARDGPALIAALRKARAARKPVIAIKVGRSEVGARAAASHTAALAGGDQVYEAVFRQCGALRVQTAEELVEYAYAASHGLYPPGRRIGLVSISGGGGILMADAAVELGLEVAPMPEAAQARLKARLPFSSPVNPVDITAQAFNEMALFASNLEIIVEEGGYDAIVAFFTTVAGSSSIAPALIEALKTVRARHPDKLIVLSLLAEPDAFKAYEALGFPVFEDGSRAVAVVAALRRIAESFGAGSAEVDAGGQAVTLPAGRLNEYEAKRLLAEAGIPVLPERLAGSATEAVAAFDTFGRPVAMKLVSAEIAHKTEIGGVILSVGDAAAVEAAYATLIERAAGLRVDGVLVSPMVEGHVETIIGVSRDPVFGPVVMFGLGGIHVEVLKDVTFRLAPFDEREAHAMIREIRGFALLDGARGAPPADLDALASALARISRLAIACGEGLESLDINPFAVLPRGEGAFALDAVIVPRTG